MLAALDTINLRNCMMTHLADIVLLVASVRGSLKPFLGYRWTHSVGKALLLGSATVSEFSGNQFPLNHRIPKFELCSCLNGYRHVTEVYLFLSNYYR